ncbi:MAG TPA: Fe(3+) ABC transporter substrate-binding protein, partial [Halomonas sp.]|nr:Fe(3+) ABC transporter substrate-binding protein [Halomonas sp.]
DGIFQSVDSDVLNERLPESMRHPEGMWFGFSQRARVIYYNRE